MATTEPEIRRGPGGDPTNPPLEQGQATELNAAAQGETQQPEILPASQPPPPVRYSPQTDEEKFLLAPSENPGEEPGSQPTVAQPHLGQAPDWLPLLQQTAADPSAPQQARDLLDIFAAGLT